MVGHELWDDMMCVKDSSLLEATTAEEKWNTKLSRERSCCDQAILEDDMLVFIENLGCMLVCIDNVGHERWRGTHSKVCLPNKTPIDFNS